MHLICTGHQIVVCQLWGLGWKNLYDSINVLGLKYLDRQPLMWSNPINSDVIAVSQINYHHLTQQGIRIIQGFSGQCQHQDFVWTTLTCLLWENINQQIPYQILDKIQGQKIVISNSNLVLIYTCKDNHENEKLGNINEKQGNVHANRDSCIVHSKCQVSGMELSVVQCNLPRDSLIFDISCI